jgi:hypothetical protein
MTRQQIRRQLIPENFPRIFTQVPIAQLLQENSVDITELIPGRYYLNVGERSGYVTIIYVHKNYPQIREFEYTVLYERLSQNSNIEWSDNGEDHTTTWRRNYDNFDGYKWYDLATGFSDDLGHVQLDHDSVELVPRIYRSGSMPCRIRN